MAIAFVQAATQVSISGSSSAAPSITLAGVTGGHALVLTASIGQFALAPLSITNVTDGGNTFTTRTGILTNGANRVFAVVSYAVNVTGGSRTVAVNLDNLSGGSDGYFTLGLTEWSGVATTSPEDTFDSNDDIDITATDASAGPITTTDAVALLVGAAAVDAPDTTMNWGSPASWTNRYRQNDSNTYYGHDSGSWLPGSIQATYTAQWSHDNAAGSEGCGIVVALKSTGGTAVSITSGLGAVPVRGTGMTLARYASNQIVIQKA